MARIDTHSETGLRVELRPEQTCVATISEAAGELSIEYFNEAGGRRSRAVNSVADVRPRDSLQVRHHQSGPVNNTRLTPNRLAESWRLGAHRNMPKSGPTMRVQIVIKLLRFKRLTRCTPSSAYTPA